MKISARQKEHLKREAKSIIEQLKDLGAKKILLFGSLARDQLRLGSDVDIIALFDDGDSFKNRIRRLYENLEYTCDLTLFPYNFEEFERLKDRSFFRHVLKEAEVVYEAPD